MSEAILCILGDIQIMKTPNVDSGILKILREADIVFGNLENPLSNRGNPTNKLITFRSDPLLVKELKRLNLTIVTLANNHILDYGYEAMFDTIQVLNENGIKHVGAGNNVYESLTPVVLKTKHVTIGFLGCASTLPLDFAANKEKPGIAPVRVKTYIHVDTVIEQEQPGTPPSIYTEPVKEDLEIILEYIEKTKAESDIVIAGMHWGVPFQYEVMDYQVKVAEEMLNAGVDVIAGHHPHVLHGIGKYSSRKYVFYSLGNFIFHYKVPKELLKKIPKSLKKLQMFPESIIVNIYIDEDGINDIKLIPVIINDDGNPRICKRDEAIKVFTLLKTLSEELGTNVILDVEEDDRITVK